MRDESNFKATWGDLRATAVQHLGGCWGYTIVYVCQNYRIIRGKDWIYWVSYTQLSLSNRQLLFKKASI